MMFEMNYTGVEEAGNYAPVPTGNYVLEIKDAEEGKSQKGDPQVNVTLIVAAGQYKGRKIWHKVTFLQPGTPGAGFSKHFLHVIGQQYEGRVTVNPLRWRGKRFEALLGIESYTNKDGQEREKNVLQEIMPLSQEEKQEVEKEDQVPF